jgi:pyrroline-5-carboxylate reductase
MPNTPALIGRGITALYPYGYPQHVTENELQTAERILGAVGQTVRILDESRGDQLLDAVTAVSGSGPAYVFFFMQAVEEAARELDLPAEIAHKLVLETFIGAAHLAAQSSEPLAVLRERVTSKGGTTAAALTSMQNAAVNDAIKRAVRAADERSRVLGEELGKD